MTSTTVYVCRGMNMKIHQSDIGIKATIARSGAPAILCCVLSLALCNDGAPAQNRRGGPHARRRVAGAADGRPQLGNAEAVFA
ncbi:MAG: hypothetical protein ACRD68_08300, partial [Pyrinomonadaceae bacterium]